MRHGPTSILARLAAIIATLLVLGLALRLLGEICAAVLPPTVLQALGTGLQRIYALTGSAIPAIVALIIVGSLIWLFVGRR
jgi:hypothetical protein